MLSGSALERFSDGRFMFKEWLLMVHVQGMMYCSLNCSHSLWLCFEWSLNFVKKHMHHEICVCVCVCANFKIRCLWKHGYSVCYLIDKNCIIFCYNLCKIVKNVRFRKIWLIYFSIYCNFCFLNEEIVTCYRGILCSVV